MFFNTTRTTETELPIRRVATVAIALITLLLVATAPAVAQSNETDTGNETDSIIYQFADGEELVDVVYEGDRALVTLRSPERATTFSIAEGAVGEEGSFSFKTVRLRPGQERTVELPVRDEAVSVTTRNDGYYHEGDLGLTVVTSTPTAELLQLSAISGVIGTLVALGIVIGQLKRKHENTYKELFSEERHEIESDPIEGYYEKAVAAIRSTSDSWYRLGAIAAIAAYFVGVVVGSIPSPGQLWLGLGDEQRLLVVGSIGATILALVPVYWLVKKIWDPNREFVFDLDSRDVYKAANGDKSGTIGVYSAPPSRISDLEVDGSVTTVSTPGGRCHLVRGFDPEANTAEANPPEIADDREVSIEVQKIDHNREILTDLATIGRDLIGAMTAFRVTADATAMRDIDAGLRDTVSAGQDSLEDVLSDAVAGTRYEGTYQPDSQTNAEISNNDPMNDDTPTVNDSSDSSGQQAATDGGEANE